MLLYATVNLRFVRHQFLGTSDYLEKMQVIWHMPSSENVGSLYKFLPMVIYLGKFILNLTSFIKILHDLTKWILHGCGQNCEWHWTVTFAISSEPVLTYEVHTISFPTFFVRAFRIVVDSWKFTILLLYILWDDWPIFMISSSNEQLQLQLEYTLLKPDCHSWWIWKMQWGHFRRTISNKIVF